MKKIILIILIMSSFGFSSQLNVWERVNQTVFKDELSIVKNMGDSSLIYAAAGGDGYVSSDNGVTWQRIFHLAEAGGRINDIYVASDNLAEIYLATTNGLYQSLNKGKHWNRIFQASDDKEAQCLSVLKVDERLYLGTAAGVFYRNAGEKQWRGIDRVKKDAKIYQILPKNEQILFVTSDTILAISRETLGVQTLWSVGQKRLDDDEVLRVIKDVEITDNGGLVIASERGMYFSKDLLAFGRLSSNGLPLKDITSLSLLEKHNCEKNDPLCANVVVGTTEGVFAYGNEQWIPLYQGMATQRVNDMALKSRNKLVAATDKGLYMLTPQTFPLSSNTQTASDEFYEAEGLVSYAQMARRFYHEPQIQQVHDMAVRYAEVHPDKIGNWRKQAHKRAWLPSVNLGVDGAKDWGASDSVYGSSSSGGAHYIGPDDKSWGEDLGWDVSLSWDFADLVWSTDQTTIDGRSKLMVELRENILDQVTRLYFERRRVQFELIEAIEAQPKLRIEKEMRIAELTALIDGLTGGGFSEQIRQNNSNSIQIQAVPVNNNNDNQKMIVTDYKNRQ